MGQTIYDDTGRGKRSMEIHQLLEKAKKVIEHQKKTDKESQKDKKGSVFQSTGKDIMGSKTPFSSAYATGMTQNTDEEALKRAEDRKIGPFCFDVDNDIETEVLVNEQVQEDLNELKDILD